MPSNEKVSKHFIQKRVENGSWYGYILIETESGEGLEGALAVCRCKVLLENW